MGILSAVVAAQVGLAGGATEQITLGSTIPAGSLLYLVIRNQTDETTTIDSVSDPVNGSWNLSTTPGTGQRMSVALDSGGTSTSYLIVFPNSAASGVPLVITIDPSAAIGGVWHAGYIETDVAMTVEEFATVNVQAGNTVDWDSSAVTADTALGVLLGALLFNSTTTLAGDAGETVPTGASSQASHSAYAAYSSTGSKQLTLTSGTSRRGQFHAVLLAEAGGGGSIVPLLRHQYMQMKR